MLLVTRLCPCPPAVDPVAWSNTCSYAGLDNYPTFQSAARKRLWFGLCEPEQAPCTRISISVSAAACLTGAPPGFLCSDSDLLYLLSLELRGAPLQLDHQLGCGMTFAPLQKESVGGFGSPPGGQRPVVTRRPLLASLQLGIDSLLRAFRAQCCVLAAHHLKGERGVQDLS